MAKTKAAHHRGTHQARAKRITDAAYADPSTRCWRCDRTMAEVRTVKPKAIWTSGHLIDSLPNGPMAPECSPCNFAAGARLTNSRRHPTNVSRTWR